MSLTSPRKRFARAITTPLLAVSLLPLHGLGAGAPQRLETLTVTATRTEQPLADLANSLSVVSRQDIEQVSAVHVSELLARTPGVWISRGNGQEHLTAIRSPVLTGAGSCGAFYVAEDGVPVRPTGFCNVNELFDLNTEQAQRIEVVRGPGSVVHGADALHGVINVISQPPNPQGETLLSLEAGANDYGRIKLSASNGNERHAVRVNFNGASDGGYKDASGFDQQKFNVRYDYHGGEWSSYSLLSGSNLNQETAGYVSGTKAYEDDSRQRENPYPEAFRDTQTLRWQTRFERVLGDDEVFMVTPYARYSDMDFLMHFLPGTPLEQNGQTSAGLQTLYRRPAGPGLTLTHGVDVEWTDAWLEQTQDDGFGPFPAGKQYDYEVEASVLAAFLAAEQELGERTTVNAGLRYEHLRYDYDNRMLNGNTDEDGVPCPGGCRYTRPADRVDEFGNYSAELGLVQEWSQAVITHGRLSRGFRAPQATEMYRLQAGQLDPDLDSEQIDSVELGIKGDVGSVSYELVAFYMEKSDVIFQSSDRLNLSDGETRHHGLEYLLAWQFAERWDIRASGTVARHRYTADVSTPGPSGVELSTDGNEVDTAPEFMGTVQLGWEPTLDTRLELEWVAMGDYYTDIDNLHSYDGHDLLHLRARHQLTDRVEVGLRVSNLTDQEYADRADYSSFSGDRYFIGEPRSLFGDIQFRF